MAAIKKKIKKSNLKDLAAPKTASKKERVQTRINFLEKGKQGLKEYSGFIQEAYNAQLFWPTVQPLYARLRTSMPEIVMIRNAFTSWARNIKPIVDLPDEPSEDDKAYQKFIQSDFDNMEGGFGAFVDTLVNHVPFMGWGWWEVLHSVRDPNWRVPVDGDDWQSEADDGLIGIRRLAWRDSSTFFGWDMPEPSRRLKGLKQQVWPDAPVTLPLDKSLHMTFGDPNNPEGSTPLQAVWRLERMKYGYEVVMGIGSEHAAGHLIVTRSDEGTLSDEDLRFIEEAAKNLLSAQEGNYGYFPKGLTGEVIDVPFSAATSILEIVKHYSILVLSVYTMQWIALNTLTSTGAQASQVDSTDTGVFTFNSMMDGFASQYDQQIGKRLFALNKDNFPGITKRPRIKFSHIDKAIALNDLSNFFRTLDGILPLSDDDYKALRQRSGFLPINVDNIQAAKEARKLDEAMNPPSKAPAQSAPGTVQIDPKTGKPALSEFGGEGSGFYAHKGRDAENLRGGSLPRGEGGGSDHNPGSQAILDLSKKQPGGFSYRPADKSVPQDGYMSSVSDGPIFSPELSDEEALTQIDSFLIDKADLLKGDNVFAGGWLNGDDNMFYLDASGNFKELNDAILSGASSHQKAIFDLNTFQEIYISDYL